MQLHEEASSETAEDTTEPGMTPTWLSSEMYSERSDRWEAEYHSLIDYQRKEREALYTILDVKVKSKIHEIIQQLQAGHQVTVTPRSITSSMQEQPSLHLVRAVHDLEKLVSNTAVALGCS